jgi:hypothetical protein
MIAANPDKALIMIQPLNRLLHGACLLFLLTGCAVKQDLVALTSAPAGEPLRKTLASPVELQLDTGYRRTLKQGSLWTFSGRVPQGDVYQPYLDVFTVEGAHIHEAYLVVDGAALVGFYLPAEHSYSPLKERTPILLK